MAAGETLEGGAHGIYELPRADSNLHDDLLRARAWIIWIGRALAATAARLRDLGGSNRLVGMVAAAFQVRTAGMALAMRDISAADPIAYCAGTRSRGEGSAGIALGRVFKWLLSGLGDDWI